MNLNERASNQTRRVASIIASINTLMNIPVNNSNTRPKATATGTTFSYQLRPYGQHQKNNSENEGADTDLNFKKKYPNSEYLSKYGFYLPSGLNITNSQIKLICRKLNKLI